MRFCSHFICLKRDMARLLRRNGTCEFPARLLGYLPVSRRFKLPGSRIAAGQVRIPSVTIVSPLPRRFTATFMNGRAAGFARSPAANEARPSPSIARARQGTMAKSVASFSRDLNPPPGKSLRLWRSSPNNHFAKNEASISLPRLRWR